MKEVLITGASGALGLAVIAHLKSQPNFCVTTLGRNALPESELKHISCDLTQSGQLSHALDSAQPDLIFHLATAFQADFPESYATNVAPSLQILEWAKKQDRRPVRVVLIGSAAEYGLVQAFENPIREDRLLAPVSVYGLTKAWQSQLVSLYASQAVDVVCARLFNLYGPGISTALFAGRLQSQIQAVLKGEQNQIDIGSLDAIRDYVSTDEAAVQLLLIAQRGLKGEIYHVASGTPIRMRDFMIQKLKEAGLNPSIVREASHLSNRVGHDVSAIYADMAKTKNLEKSRM